MVVAAELLRPLTIEDLADFPDDGMRREIVTGELVVTPAPTPAHQIISGRLFKGILPKILPRSSGLTPIRRSLAG